MARDGKIDTAVGRILQNLSVLQRHPKGVDYIASNSRATLAGDTHLFKWNNTDYIVAVEYRGRYFDVERTTSLTSNTVTQKSSFCLLGFKYLIRDNRSCYSFKDFAHAWYFEHVTCGPIYPRSNWLTKMAKILMEKAHAQHDRPLPGSIGI